MAYREHCGSACVQVNILVEEVAINIVRWEPFREFEDMFRQHSPFFARPLRREGGDMIEWSPVADISETDKEFLIKAELPEVKKEDVKVTL